MTSNHSLTPFLSHLQKDLKSRIDFLEKYLADIKKELAFYKTTVENCRNIFDKHRNEESAFKSKKEEVEDEVDVSEASATKGTKRFGRYLND